MLVNKNQNTNNKFEMIGADGIIFVFYETEDKNKVQLILYSRFQIQFYNNKTH